MARLVSLGSEPWYESMFGSCPSHSSSYNSLATTQKSMFANPPVNGPLTSILTFSQTTLLPSVLCAKQRGQLPRIRRHQKSHPAARRRPACAQPVKVSSLVAEVTPTECRKRPSRERASQASRVETSFTGLRRRSWDWQSEKEERVLRQYCPDLFEDEEDMPQTLAMGSREERLQARRSSNAQLYGLATQDFAGGITSTTRDHKTQAERQATFLEHAAEASMTRTPTAELWKHEEKARLDTVHSLAKAASVLEDVDARTRRLVFAKYASLDRTIPRARLGAALTLFGYEAAEITDEAIKKWAIEVAGKRQHLDFEQFLEFCEAFDADHVFGAVKKFCDADLDGNGYLSPGEVSMLLQKSGITVIPGIVKELMEEVGAEDAERVNQQEFELLLNVIRTRGGFTKHESQKYMSLYERYDHDRCGKIDYKEFLGVLDWVSLFVAREKSEDRKQAQRELLQNFEAETDDFGRPVTPDETHRKILEPEFLYLMRKSRELEIGEISKKMDELDTNCEGKLALADTCEVLADLGFKMPSEAVVLECFASVGVPETQTEYFFDDILMMTRAFHETEGASIAEIKEFKEVFKSNDCDDSGSIDAVELGSVLRWLGCPADIEVTQDLMEEIDFDKSGEVDFDEFVRVMRRFREDELTRLETLFRSADEDHSGFLDLKELKFLILTLGYQPTYEQTMMLQTKFSARDASYMEVIDMVKTFREQVRLAFQENQGFDKKELKNLRTHFDKLDTKGTGQIDHDQLKALVAKLYPDVTTASSEEVDAIIHKFVFGRRPATISRTHKETVGDHTSSTEHITFQECLKLMRMVADRADHLTFLRQKEVSQENGFDSFQVMQLRKIFKLADKNFSHVVCLPELQELFTNVFPISAEAAASLLEQVTASDINGDDSLDFTEFMRLVRSMLDSGEIDEAQMKSMMMNY